MSNSTLHTLNRGPNDLSLLNSLSDAISPVDVVLLIEDGVYWALPEFRSKLLALNCTQIYQLKPDTEARGIADTGLADIDDSGFVNLVTQHKRMISWF